MLSLTKLSLALLVGFLGWCYISIQPPPPKICGSPNGPPITSPRIKLRDGRYLSYKESGVPKEEASYKFVVVHGFGDSKDFSFPASKGVVEGLGIYFVSFDRAGYGESDPNPSRSVKSEALDIEELADKLELGSRFYVICASMGCYSAWGCFKYIPHRLAGAALVVPVVNYWWPSFPSNLSKEAYGSLLVQDQWTLRMAHYAPSSLFYWWMTQKWFPSLAMLDGHPESYSHQDREILQKMVKAKAEVPSEDKARQQGDFESLHRDLLVGFGTWDFDPVDIANPFPNSEGSVHLWQGYEDRFIPFKLQRFVSMRLPWIKYHEVPDGGHLFLYLEAMSDAILRELLGGQASTVFG